MARDCLKGSGELEYEALENAAEKEEPGCKGMIVIPHFGGRILPYAPEMRGGVIGLTWNQTEGAIYRSIMEGIAYEYAGYVKRFKEMYPQYFSISYIPWEAEQNPDCSARLKQMF